MFESAYTMPDEFILRIANSECRYKMFRIDDILYGYESLDDSYSKDKLLFDEGVMNYFRDGIWRVIDPIYYAEDDKSVISLEDVI